jgi:hypothetical protein
MSWADKPGGGDNDDGGMETETEIRLEEGAGEKGIDLSDQPPRQPPTPPPPPPDRNEKD